jgi:hypothetical protein
MTCAECEKLIYLYTELDPDEKQKLTRHLETCSSCKELFASIQRKQEVLFPLLKSVPEKFENENPFLTAKIISAIQSGKVESESIIERFLPFLRFEALRYSMAAVSLMLVALFIKEMKPTEQAVSAIAYYKKMPIRKTVQLNSVAFREQLKKTVKTNRPELAAAFSLSVCLEKCRGGSNESDCTKCEKLFNQIKNEGI